MAKNWRVAIASSDGKMVNRHFGRAQEFCIVDITPEGEYKFVERRPVVPLCSNREHSQEGLEKSVSALRDCVAVLVSQIGDTARRALELNKISVFDCPGFIEDALPKLVKYFVNTHFSVLEE